MGRNDVKSEVKGGGGLIRQAATLVKMGKNAPNERVQKVYDSLFCMLNSLNGNPSPRADVINKKVSISKMMMQLGPKLGMKSEEVTRDASTKTERLARTVSL